MLKIYILIFISLLTNTVFAAKCETLDCVIDGLLPHLNSIGDMIYPLAYVSGIAFGIKAILKLRDMSESKGQIKLSTVIILFAASGLCMGFPSLISGGAETFSLNISDNLKPPSKF